MGEEAQLNVGTMPHTDFRYEEFEGLLASIYLSLLPLKESSRAEDVADWEKIVGILDDFAARHKVQKPEAAAEHPRPTLEEWGQPSTECCFTLCELVTRSFMVDFGVCKGEDAVALCDLAVTMGVALERHGVLKLRRENDVPMGFESFSRDKEFLTLAQVMEEA
ncbi:MAG: hypothetical protein WC080_01070 [Patescibacteria group bacterium]|jgi:hypothetical protein